MMLLTFNKIYSTRFAIMGRYLASEIQYFEMLCDEGYTIKETQLCMTTSFTTPLSTQLISGSIWEVFSIPTCGG